VAAVRRQRRLEEIVAKRVAVALDLGFGKY
jgi:hypothetical protein